MMYFGIDNDGCIGMCRNMMHQEISNYLKPDIKNCITIKGVPKMIDDIPTPEEYIGDFFTYVSVSWRALDKAHTKKRGVTLTRSLQSKCEQYMREVFPVLWDGFLIGSGHRTIENAVAETENFGQLWDEFHSWFNTKRERYMKKTELKIKEQTGVVPSNVPKSHGGVANLLKVLTRTMELQGAHITSIAKMQAALCLQAGIYLPDEFLTDVAVALDYAEAIERVEHGKA